MPDDAIADVQTAGAGSATSAAGEPVHAQAPPLLPGDGIRELLPQSTAAAV